MASKSLNFALPDPKRTRIEIALSEPRTTIQIIDTELLLQILSYNTVSAPDVLLKEHDNLDGVHELQRGFKNEIERILIKQDYAEEYVDDFVKILALRLAVVEQVAHIKAQYKGTPPKDEKQWGRVLRSIIELGEKEDLDEIFIINLWNAIHAEAVRIEGKIIDGYAIGEEYSTQS